MFTLPMSGVEHQHRDIRSIQHVLGNATEYPLPQATATVGAHNQEI
jgi:hypothetical protein